MNKVLLIGRLTRDPETRQTASGNVGVNFTIAVNRNFKNRDGVIEADFIPVVCWSRQAESISKYCFKGSQVSVEGRMQVRNYDAQDGTKRYVTEVVADRVEFLTPKGGAGSSNASSDFMDAPMDYDMPDMPSVEETDIPKEDPYKDFGDNITLSDDDLPF